jgi:hypothetical protein
MLPHVDAPLPARIILQLPYPKWHTEAARATVFIHCSSQVPFVQSPLQVRAVEDAST